MRRGSHPTRGAWIEIAANRVFTDPLNSRTLPGVRGLKFHRHYKCDIYIYSRTLPGVRGLKYIYREAEGAGERVAPYPGCVD